MTFVFPKLRLVCAAITSRLRPRFAHWQSPKSDPYRSRRGSESRMSQTFRHMCSVYTGSTLKSIAPILSTDAATVWARSFRDQRHVQHKKKKTFASSPVLLPTKLGCFPFSWADSQLPLHSCTLPGDACPPPTESKRSDLAWVFFFDQQTCAIFELTLSSAALA